MIGQTISQNDPRINPIPGDILCGQDETRIFVRGPEGTGQFIRYKSKGRGNLLFETTLGMWRRWAEDATILKRG